LDLPVKALEQTITATQAATGGHTATGGNGISISGASSGVTDKVIKLLNDWISAVENQKGDRYDSPKGSFGSPFEVEQFVVDKKVQSCGKYWDLFSIRL